MIFETIYLVVTYTPLKTKMTLETDLNTSSFLVDFPASHVSSRGREKPLKPIADRKLISQFCR